MESVDLKLNSEDNSSQENFNIEEKTLTIKEALKQNTSLYERTLIQSGQGENAKLIKENLAIKSNFPKKMEINEYKIGVGDTITFSRLIENNRSRIETDNQWPENINNFPYKLGIGDVMALTLLREDPMINNLNPANLEQNQNLDLTEQNNNKVINSKGRIGSDGSVLLLEVGRLEAKGKTLNDLRSEVRNILIRNGVSPRFQLEIVEFRSQKAYLTINELSNIIVLNDQETTLRDILTKQRVGFKPGVKTQVVLQRDGEKSFMTLRKIFSENSPDITIKSGDHIFVKDSSSQMRSVSSTVGHDGYLVLEGIGKIKADGRSISQLRSEISSVIEKLPDTQNSFQIEITQFNSQFAL